MGPSATALILNQKNECPLENLTKNAKNKLIMHIHARYLKNKMSSIFFYRALFRLNIMITRKKIHKKKKASGHTPTPP